VTGVQTCALPICGDGTIDAIATDHAPHPPEAKDVPFDTAPPGMLGLQTALPIAWQVLGARLSPERIFALLTSQPAAIAGLSAAQRNGEATSAQGGPIAPGAA